MMFILLFLASFWVGFAVLLVSITQGSGKLAVKGAVIMAVSYLVPTIALAVTHNGVDLVGAHYLSVYWIFVIPVAIATGFMFGGDTGLAWVTIALATIAVAASFTYARLANGLRIPYWIVLIPPLVGGVMTTEGYLIAKLAAAAIFFALIVAQAPGHRPEEKV